MVSTLTIVFVHSLRLRKLVDLSTYKAGQDLLRELMGHGLACKTIESMNVSDTYNEASRHALFTLVVFEEFEALECSSTGYELATVVSKVG